MGKHKPSYEELEKQIAELKNRLKIEETRMPPRTPAHGADDETPRTQDETGDKYKWLFENEPAALVLVDAQTLRFMDVNIAACKLFGRSREEFLQLTVTDISAEPADSMRVMSSTEERKTVNIPLRMCKKKDGTVFPVDLSLIVFPLKGKKTVYGVFRDISEQKKMEAELRESEERFRSIIENSGAGYFFIDSAGILRNVNNAWLKLYGFSTPEEIIGRDFTEVQAPEDVESAKDFANGILQGKKEYMRGVFSRKGNASEIGYNTFSAWPVIKNNAAIGIEGFVIDTTEQVKAEEIIRNFAKFPSENPNPVFRVNREGAIVFANPGSAPVLQAWNTEAGGMVPDFLWKKIQPFFDYKSHTALEVEVNEKTYSFVIAPVRNENYVNLYGTDITDRKKMEEALKASEQQNRDILQTTMDGFWLTDTAGRFLRVNDTYCRMSGYSEAELLSMSIKDIDVNESESDTAAHIEKVIFEGQDRFETKHRRKDGSVYDVEISVQHRTAHGEHLVVFIRDITAYRKAEREYKTLFREMLDGFALHEIICDEDGAPVDYRFIAVNPAFERMTGLNGESVAGKTVLEVMPKTEKYWIERYGKVALSGEPAIFENYSAEIGKHFYVTAFQPEQNHFACIFTDVTDRKNSEAELELYREHLEDLVKARTNELRKAQDKLIAAERLAVLGEFSGAVAHEIRNPLAAIGSTAYLLKMNLSKTNPEIDLIHLRNIESEVNKCASIIDSITRMARNDPPKEAPVDLNRLVEKTFSDNISYFKGQKEISLPPETIIIQADQANLRIALKNLIANAIQAMDGDGTLSVKLAEHCDEGTKWARIIISDTGTGISEDLMGRIFEPLFSTKTHGMGFGLPIVKMIITRHGGRLYAESEEGRGTAFTIDLPLA